MNDAFMPYIPYTITVHLGRPNTAAENVTVSFRDYVKNVASSEVYPTWETEALQANILAITSFALNRVYLEYYPSRGYDFDITSSTAYDQKYTHGRDTFENINDLVDALSRSYLRRRGAIEPLFAAFCNGTTSICAGMSQWGSQRMAQAGLSALEILRNYYGSDIEIVENAPVDSPHPSYPGRPIQLGSAGQAVFQIQVRLNRIARNYPAIPRIPATDGLFGPATDQAVRAFQRIFNLSVDGIVGAATWYQIISIYVGVMQLSELQSEGERFDWGSFALPTVLSLGSSGSNVEKLQYMLNVASDFVPELRTVEIDGQYGVATRNAVLAYQRFAGLTTSGLVGEATWNSLINRYAGITGTVIEDGDYFPFS